MEPILAYCGLDCETCPIHLATIEKDKNIQFEMRKSIAKKCSEVYNIEMLPEEITDCDGCKANTGRFFNGCNECSIQKCAITKTFESCGLCDVFPCEILEQHFLYDPSSKTRLEEVRWQLHI